MIVRFRTQSCHSEAATDRQPDAIRLTHPSAIIRDEAQQNYLTAPGVVI